MPCPASSLQYRALAKESRDTAKLTLSAAAKSELLGRADHYEKLAEEIEYWGQLGVGYRVASAG
jgi:hypothetical protein